MYNLVGVFVVEDPEETLEGVKLFPFTLVFPNTSRVFYLLKASDREKWMELVKSVVGYSNIHDFYELKENIGKGKFAVVRRGLHKKTGKTVAVKILKKQEMSAKDLELQRREIEILKICQHPNIIRLIDLFENESHLFLVIEHLSGGDMFDYLAARDFEISEKRAKKITHKIATALYYMHRFGIAYRDLKPENIMMEKSADDSDLKLVDFGLSKIVGPKETSTEPFGTISYAAPEVLTGKPYDKSVDMWSLGVVIYLLVAGTLPFDDDDEKKVAYKTIYDEPNWTSPWIAKVSTPGKDLIKKLLKKKAEDRINIEQVLSHEWITSENEALRNKRQQEEGKFEAYSSMGS